MSISKNILLDEKLVISAIYNRQCAPWNSGRINDYRNYDIIQELFRIINSGIPKEDFFYSGDIYRLHTQKIDFIENVDHNKEQVIGEICNDGSCSVLPYTDYSEKLVAFSKSFDFTDHNIYYKVYPQDRCRLIHVNTKYLYGIDVNKLEQRFGVKTRYNGEQEILFPLLQEFVIKEYTGTPNQFKYYLRNK